jgi:uncharacterized protein (TIGR00288 family)
MRKIGIYCDLSNLYYCIKLRYQKKLDFGKFMDFCKGYGEVSIAKAYGAQIGNQADKFITALNKVGFETFYKTPKTYNKGSALQQSKADHDITITIDVIKDLDDIDAVVLATADGDFAPLVHYLLEQNKDVFIMGCGISHELQCATQLVEIPPMVLL